MHKPTNVFIATMILFAAGTSAIGYSLASDAYSSSQPVHASFTLINLNNIPWYCVSTKPKVKAQGTDGSAGYYPSGYYPSGYNPSGYKPTNPGYQPTTPGYAPKSGYQPTKPGYVPTQPEPAKPPTQFVSLPAKLQGSDFNNEWRASLPCPNGYKLDTDLVVNKCSIALQKKLDGNPLPAESKEQYLTCQKILKPGVWNAKISTKICGAFYSYESECAASQKVKKPCQPLSKYLVAAGVANADIPKTQSDAIYLCKDVYPKP